MDDRASEALPGNNGANSPSARFTGQTAPTILKSLYDATGSWRDVANKVGNVSPALCWKVANEECESRKIDRALGLTRRRYRVSLEVDTPADAAALRRIFDAHGSSRREVAERLLNDEIRIMEVE